MIELIELCPPRLYFRVECGEGEGPRCSVNLQLHCSVHGLEDLRGLPIDVKNPLREDSLLALTHIFALSRASTQEEYDTRVLASQSIIDQYRNVVLASPECGTFPMCARQLLLEFARWFSSCFGKNIESSLRQVAALPAGPVGSSGNYIEYAKQAAEGWIRAKQTIPKYGPLVLAINFLTVMKLAIVSLARSCYEARVLADCMLQKVHSHYTRPPEVLSEWIWSPKAIRGFQGAVVRYVRGVWDLWQNIDELLLT